MTPLLDDGLSRSDWRLLAIIFAFIAVLAVVGRWR